MLFNEAVSALKEGNIVTRESWGPCDGYIIFMPGMKNVWKITVVPSVNAGNNLFSMEDYMAEDWQISNGANEDTKDEDASNGSDESVTDAA